MISYREKQLLMVMKMLQDETTELSLQLTNAINETQQGMPLTGNISYLQEPIADYDVLVEMAEEKGYDMSIRASDILTEEELRDIEQRKDEIDQKFKAITKLHGVDYVFLLAAIALQIARQAVQPRLDFESLDVNKRENDKKTANKTDKTQARDKANKAQHEAEKHNINQEKSKEYYYASVADITNLKHVPYDAVIPGLSGKTHRFKTLGHDPKLGYLFGTCNILTNTLTTSDMKTVHIKNNTKYANADTAKMFKYSQERFSEKGGKAIVAAAIAKQAYHIKSDQKSKAGIGLPFLQLICDEKTIRTLCEKGIDYNAAEFAETVAKQALFAEMINFIVATSHRILIAKEEFDTYCNENHIEDEVTLIASLKHKGFHDIVFGNESLNEVRTRKILLISNTVASSANIIYTGIVAGVSAYAGDDAGVYDALSKLDVGGILVTLKHLLSDGRVIAKIKNDFIQNAINSDFEAKLAAIEAESV